MFRVFTLFFSFHCNVDDLSVIQNLPPATHSNVGSAHAQASQPPTLFVIGDENNSRPSSYFIEDEYSTVAED